MYEHENATDPACVKSQTGYAIRVIDYVVVFMSTFQTETALSTIKAEIIALACSCHELFPVTDVDGLLKFVVR